MASGSAGQVVGLPAARDHLVEYVDAVDVVGSVDFHFLLEETLLDFGEEFVFRVEEPGVVFQCEAGPVAHPLDLRIGIDAGQFRRDVPGEGREDGFHVELPFAGHDFLLQGFLSFQPGFGQRPAPAVDVQHPVPGQVGGTGEIAADFFIRKPQLRPDLVPDRFLTGDGQRQVDAVEGHPVDEVLPFLPVPPGHRIAIRAVVQEETLRNAGIHPHGGLEPGKRLGHRALVPGEPADVGVAVIFQIIVEAHGHRVGVVAAHHDPAAFAAQDEIVTGIGREGFEDEMPGCIGDDAGRQCRGCLGIRSPVVFLCTASSHRQGEDRTRIEEEAFHRCWS